MRQRRPSPVGTPRREPAMPFRSVFMHCWTGVLAGAGQHRIWLPVSPRASSLHAALLRLPPFKKATISTGLRNREPLQHLVDHLRHDVALLFILCVAGSDAQRRYYLGGQRGSGTRWHRFQNKLRFVAAVASTASAKPKLIVPNAETRVASSQSWCTPACGLPYETTRSSKRNQHAIDCSLFTRLAVGRHRDGICGRRTGKCRERCVCARNNARRIAASRWDANRQSRQAACRRRGFLGQHRNKKAG